MLGSWQGSIMLGSIFGGTYLFPFKFNLFNPFDNHVVKKRKGSKIASRGDLDSTTPGKLFLSVSTRWLPFSLTKFLSHEWPSWHLALYQEPFLVVILQSPLNVAFSGRPFGCLLVC